MKVEIKIECDDIQDLKMHLSVIRGQILNRAKKMTDKKDSLFSSKESVSEISMNFEDSNCYGSHEVKFTGI